MSKLQATLAKINSKATPAKLADRLHIPEQRDQDDSVQPIDAAAIKTWLISQNAVNNISGRSTYATEAETLLKTLQNSNRIICTPSVRLQIMEVYEKPFTRAMQSLDSLYLYLDFPLEADAEKAFSLAAALCQEMAFGYKIVVADTLKRPTKDNKFALINQMINKSQGNRTDKAKRTTAIRSANKYLTNLALRYSQLNRDWPSELWQDLNVMLNIATLDRSSKVAENVNADQQVTIEHQYASLCALHIIDQKKLTAENIRSLFLQIRGYTNLITFHTTAQSLHNHLTRNSLPDIDQENQSSQAIYSVAIDSPPEPDDLTLPQPVEKFLYFSPDALLSKLDTDDNTDSRYQLSAGSERRHSRTQRSVVITAETGLQNIHTRISITPPVESAESQFTDLIHLLSNDSNRSATAQHALNQTDVLNQNINLVCSTSFEVENESPGGFGLRWTGEGSCRVRVGELLAHHYQHSGYQDPLVQGSRVQSAEYKFDNDHNTNHETSWHLSVVRWLRTDEDGILRLSVESLSHHTKAVSIKRLMRSERSTESIVEGLLINYQPIDSKAEMLVLPRHNYKAGETVACRDDRNIHTAQLVECVEMSGSYQCFAIRNIEDEIIFDSRAESDQYRVAS